MEALLNFVLSNAFMATLLAALASAASRLCRSAAVRHALWLVVLLKLITPPLVPLSVTANGRRLPAGELPPLPAGELTRLPVGELSHQPTDPDRLPDQPGDAGRSSDQPADAGRSPDVWVPLLMVIWLGSSLAWWTAAAVRLRKFQRLLRQARPAPAEVREQAQRVAALIGLRRCPAIVFASAPLSPMLWALGLSPRLLVPVELWRKLTEEQQDTLLAHELAHLRRGDPWVRRLELLVLGLYWWHPVAWWARRRLQEAEEECCDALVVAALPDAAPAYASALVQTVVFLSQTRFAAPFGASGAGHVPLLKRRLTMILTETSSRKRPRLAFWIVLGLGAILLPLAPRVARIEAVEEPQGEVEKGAPLKINLPSMTSQVYPFGVDFGFPVDKGNGDALAGKAQNCTACHKQPVHDDGFHGHPEWRHAHDEIVRLMDEIRQKQALLNRFAKGLPAAVEPDRTQEIEKIQDEIELLKVQVRLKEVRVDGFKRLLDEYRRRLKTAEGLRRSVPGSVSRDEIAQLQLSVTTQENQIQINEAELQESQVRLKQAERRLARLQGTAEKPDGGGREQKEKRLRELEQKVDSLLKEIRDLRREMQPQKPGGKTEGKGKTTQRQERMLRWILRFKNENATEYLAQLRNLGAILAIPVREEGNNREYKVVRDLKAHPAPLLEEDINKIDRIYWIDDKPRSVADVLTTLGIRLPHPPSHFYAFMPEELEQKLYRLEKSFLAENHSGRTENDIRETSFRLKRSGSKFEPEVAGMTVR